jgi:hypothetical protein
MKLLIMQFSPTSCHFFDINLILSSNLRLGLSGGTVPGFPFLSVSRLCRVKRFHEWWMMNWKAFGRKRPCPNWSKTLSISQGSRCQNRDSNLVSSGKNPELPLNKTFRFLSSKFHDWNVSISHIFHKYYIQIFK